MLTIYRASAGAGKTHRLTGDYLKLLFAYPGAYRRILAVTFTNKATDEMKSRIIEELHHLSSGHHSAHIDDLCTFKGWTEQQLRLEAREVLVTILHDYSAFHISTIDRFFQQTMRAFTREIGLQGGYGIEMDEQLVLTEAVDNLLSDLDKQENKVLLGWLLRFAADKIEDGGEWNLRKDIMSLGREVFKETYKSFSDRLTDDIADKALLEEYKKELMVLIRSVENEAKALGERGMQLLRDYSLLPTDFKGTSRSPLLLLEKLAAGEMKEPSATFCKLIDNVEGCYTKTTDPEKGIAIIRVFNNGLNECIKGIVTLFSNLTNYYTAKEIIRYYYTLGILTDISRHIAAYREEKNVMLIADTTELLNKVIDGSDAPFVYEKTGTRVDHYMVDEFQDTSGMQWHNFRPLMQESIAHRHENLIVGDVKQSIYRFRNSDWKLLDQKVKHDFLPQEVVEKTLNENWRSCRSIVSFNNTLFTVAPELLQSVYNEVLETSSLSPEEKQSFFTKIASAYAHNYQQTAPPFREKEGHVRVEFISGEEEDKSWKEEVLDRLPPLLERLQDNGYALRDIALLVRTNMEGALLADYLLSYAENNPAGRYRYDIISDDSLFVGSSPSVRFIVSLLRYVYHSDDPSFEHTARFSWYLLTGQKGQPADFLTDDQKEQLNQLSTLSLYEMTEGIYRLYSDSFPANEHAFLQAFLDLIAEYGRKENNDPDRFLRWWDETGTRKPIASPDGQDAIRIMTIHKAKGLGMKVVILPFGEWEIDHRPTKPVILWCRPEDKPFNRLSLVPVRYSKGLASTRFAADYFNEKLYAYIDNLNTLYVALTRAKEELIIFSPRPKKTDRIDSISKLLMTSLSTPVEDTRVGEPLDSFPPAFDEETGIFEWGEWWKPAHKTQNEEVEEVTVDHLTSVSPDERLRLRLYGKGFFFDDPRRKQGVVMHELLSRIKTRNDISTSVESFRQEGIINREEAAEMEKRLQTLLSKPEIAPWYTLPTRVLNEVEILSEKGKNRRPDRVMISGGKAIVVDYKFGEVTDARHSAQVRNYIRLIRGMGYTEVEGYLWYVELDKIESVV